MSRGLGDVYKRQVHTRLQTVYFPVLHITSPLPMLCGRERERDARRKTRKFIWLACGLHKERERERERARERIKRGLRISKFALLLIVSKWHRDSGRIKWNHLLYYFQETDLILRDPSTYLPAEWKFGLEAYLFPIFHFSYVFIWPWSKHIKG